MVLQGPWVVPEPEPSCPGFAWIGQAVNHCDSCGAPVWEHEFFEEIDRESPFTNPPKWVYKPISQEVKDRWRNFFMRDDAYQGKQSSEARLPKHA